MSHDDIESRIPFFIAGTLSHEESARFQQHLQDCASCRSEVEVWKRIAAVVWEKADEGAHPRPALSGSFYAALSPRRNNVISQIDLRLDAPSRAEQRHPRHIASAGRRQALPFTLAAVLLVAVVFGALLLRLAAGRQPQPLALSVAELSSPQVNEKTSGSETPLPPQPTGTPILPTDNRLADSGILPTLEPTVTPQTPPGAGGYGGGADADLVALQPLQQNLASGPYATITPDLMEDGYHLCMLFNPTQGVIQSYTTADYGSAPAAGVLPGYEYRTLIRSASGWYQIFIDAGVGWVPPESAYLRGNCDAGLFWVPTPTVMVTFTPLPTVKVSDIIFATGDTTAIVDVPSANIYAGPGFEHDISDTMPNGTLLPVKAYADDPDGNFWLQVMLPYYDGRQGWVPVSAIIEYNNAVLPATATPMP